MIARRRTTLEIATEAQGDLLELGQIARDAVFDTLEDIQSHPRHGEPKGGRLEGAFSWAFFASADETRPQGRIVYVIKRQEIRVFALSDVHDTAYKLARDRAARYL